jgi:hypothetical protein
MDRNSRLVWLVTGIAVAMVWAVGLRFDKRQRAVPAAATPPGAERALERDTARPDAAGAAALARPSPSAPSASEPAKAPSTLPVAHLGSPGQILPSAFLTETRDSTWAQDAEATIEAAFADAQVPEGSLLSVECRRRICKAEIWFDPRQHEAFGKAYATLRDHFGTDVGFHRIRGGIRGEPEHIAAYFPRKGYTLKDFERPAR